MEGNRIIEKTTYRKLRTSIVKKRFFFTHLGPISKQWSQIHITRIIKSNGFFPTKKKQEGKNINTNWYTECYSSSERKKSMIQTGENEVQIIYKSMDGLCVKQSSSNTESPKNYFFKRNSTFKKIFIAISDNFRFSTFVQKYLYIWFTV